VPTLFRPGTGRRLTAPPTVPSSRRGAAARHPRRHSLIGLAASYVLSLWILATLVFAVPRAIAGDPLAGYANQNGTLQASVADYYTAYYGLNRPLINQYGRYLSNVAHGNLGESIAGQVPVNTLLGETLPWTLLLVGVSVLASSVLSFVLGTDAGWNRGKADDRLMTVITTFLHALPDFALAIFLLIGFAVLLRAFPTSGGSTPFNGSASTVSHVVDVTHHLVLPATALTLVLMAGNFLLVRNVTIGVLGQDYMVLARAKGLPERLLKRRHAGRNVLPPFFNLVGLHVGFAVGGAIFIEKVFAYPGVGSLMVTAVGGRDYPVIEATFLVLAFLVLTANLVVDVVCARLDPRIRSR
jgi:peptide/nickel transport system permease protein